MQRLSEAKKVKLRKFLCTGKIDSPTKPYAPRRNVPPEHKGDETTFQNYLQTNLYTSSIQWIETEKSEEIIVFDASNSLNQDL
jgi:hypothetical protein